MSLKLMAYFFPVVGIWISWNDIDLSTSDRGDTFFKNQKMFALKMLFLVNLDLASKYVYIVSNMAVLHVYVTLQFILKIEKIKYNIL